jgi:hypothetical protein
MRVYWFIPKPLLGASGCANGHVITNLEIIMYVVVTNPVFESENITSCKCQSEPMSLDDAERVASFINWNRANLGDEAWILNLETGEWIPPEEGYLEEDDYDDF